MRFIYIFSCLLLPLVSMSHTKSADAISAFTIIPDVPQSFVWADENIQLDRFDMRERFDRELSAFCFNHTSTLLVLKRANRYLPIIKPIVEEMGLPSDFIYLAAIESSLNPRAASPAGAVGIWQIMPATAKSLGLEITEYVDERYNVIKSTRAACKYLKSAYKKYGSWITAAASYNAGQYRISSELEKQLQKHAFNLWLNDETSRYIFRLMAIKAVMENPLHYGFVIKKAQLYPQIRFNEIEVTEDITDLSAFAGANNITFSQLKEFNPWLRDRKLPVKNGNSYMILIPYIEDLFYSSNKQPIYDSRCTID